MPMAYLRDGSSRTTFADDVRSLPCRPGAATKRAPAERRADEGMITLESRSSGATMARARFSPPHICKGQDNNDDVRGN